MTVAFDNLKKLLEEKKTLTHEEVAAAEKEHGAMTDEEKFWLESEKHNLERKDAVTVTMDDYLAATKVLDSTPEDSEEHKKALAIVEKFESGM